MSQDFYKELIEKRKAVEKLLRSITVTSSAASVAGGEGPEMRNTTPDTDDELLSETRQKMSTLQQKWNLLWRLSLDMKKKLQDNYAALLQVLLHHVSKKTVIIVFVITLSNFHQL